MSRLAACLLVLFILCIVLPASGLAQLVGSASAAQTDSEFYSALADQARATAASARRTAAGERENASQARENAETWRDIANEARGLGQEDNARFAEDRAYRAENDAREADAAVRRAERRAQIAEREAQTFDGKAGREGVKEAVERHAAVLVDPNTVFHRLYIIGAPDNDEEREAWASDTNDLQQTLEGAGSQAAGSTTTTLVTPEREDIRTTLVQIQTLAVPGDEVTIYYSGHGGGGPFWGGSDLENEDNEEYEEHININDSQALTDDELATWLRGFAPGVSITLLLDSCFGGGFTGGSTDIQENNSVNVIGVANSCPGTGRTLTRDAIRGSSGAADYDGDGIVTAVELENFLRAEGWDVRAPSDDSDDLSVREQLEVWGGDLANWIRGARVKPPAAPPFRYSFDQNEPVTFGVQSGANLDRAVNTVNSLGGSISNYYRVPPFISAGFEQNLADLELGAGQDTPIGTDPIPISAAQYYLQVSAQPPADPAAEQAFRTGMENLQRFDVIGYFEMDYCREWLPGVTPSGRSPVTGITGEELESLPRSNLSISEIAGLAPDVTISGRAPQGTVVGSFDSAPDLPRMLTDEETERIFKELADLTTLPAAQMRVLNMIFDEILEEAARNEIAVRNAERDEVEKTYLPRRITDEEIDRLLEELSGPNDMSAFFALIVEEMERKAERDETEKTDFSVPSVPSWRPSDSMGPNIVLVGESGQFTLQGSSPFGDIVAAHGCNQFAIPFELPGLGIPPAAPAGRAGAR